MIQKRKGIGRLLYDRLEEILKKQGILKVIDGSKGLDTCFEDICNILEG